MSTTTRFSFATLSSILREIRTTEIKQVIESMPEPAFSVSQADWEQDKARLREIRRQVFIVEQNVPQKLEWDNKDDTALHVIAIDADGNPIGTGRLSIQGQIGRMAVLAAWRGRGVGSALLGYLLKIADQVAEMPPLYLNAQQNAIPFYQQHGFVPEGKLFIEAGIPHQRMSRKRDATVGQPA